MVVASYTSNSTRKLFYILAYGLRIILCVRANHISEQTWVGLRPIEPRARDQGPRPKELRAGAWVKYRKVSEVYLKGRLTYFTMTDTK